MAALQRSISATATSRSSCESTRGSSARTATHCSGPGGSAAAARRPGSSTHSKSNMCSSLSLQGDTSSENPQHFPTVSASTVSATDSGQQAGELVLLLAEAVQPPQVSVDL